MHILRSIFTILLTVLAVDAHLVQWPPTEGLSERQVINAASGKICNGRDSHWFGWPKIRHIFAFGDSYSSNGFSAAAAQPNSTWPLGNPTPYQPNITSSSGGPNWLENLVMGYNRTYVKLYDLAFGGATVDRELTPELYPSIPSMVEQVNDIWIPYYGFRSNRSSGWSPQHTLFTTFFGINDVIITTSKNNDTLQRAIFDSYFANLQTLWRYGARNFLILKIPPFDLSPWCADGGDETVSAFASNVALWNDRVTSMAYNLTLSYRDTTVFLFDTYRVFKKVLADPGSYLATSQITNTTGFCPAYGSGTPTQDYYNSTCPLPVNRYFWLNSLHPTWPIHNVMAAEISYMLEENAFGRIYI